MAILNLLSLHERRKKVVANSKTTFIFFPFEFQKELMEPVSKNELFKKAADKISNSHILINTVAHRIRHLNDGDSGYGRPLVEETARLSKMEIALREIVEDKIACSSPPSQETEETLDS